MDKERLMLKLMAMDKKNIDMVKSFILGIVAYRQFQSVDVRKNEMGQPLMKKRDDKR